MTALGKAAMGHRARQARSLLLGCGTLVSVVCFFVLRFSLRDTGRPRTLLAAVVSMGSTDGPGAFFFGRIFCVPILLTVFLPPLLWVELAIARRPLSGRMRALLIGQGVLGAGGIALTVICMSLSLAYFGFGGDSDPESAGFYIIPACESVFVLASLVMAVLRPGP